MARLKKLSEKAAGITGSGIANELSLNFVGAKEMAEINEDDLNPELKRKMRRREHKTMNELEKLFTFSDIFPEPVLMGDTHT